MRISDWSSDACSSELLLLDQQLRDLLELRRIALAQRPAAELAADLEDRAGLSEQRHPAGILVRVVQPLPAVRHAVDLALAVAAAHGPPHTSEARRVGNACVITCRPRWRP